MTKELQVITSNLYMGIVSRLAEPEARKIIFQKEAAKAAGVPSLQKVTSAVNVSAAQALLAEEFDIMFREFHEFVLVGGKIGRYLPHERVSEYRALGETRRWINDHMPAIIADTMEKIIRKAPYDGAAEEEKTEDASASPEEVKVELDAEGQ